MEINPYVQIVKSVHRQLSPIITIILMLKSDIIQSVIFYSIMEIIKFNGLFILTSNFDISIKDRKDKVEITNIFRTFTFHKICEVFKLKQIHYFIICGMIITKKIIYCFLLIRLYIRIKYKINVDSIFLSRGIKGIFYFELLCSPIFIEFLFYIYYIIFLPDVFIIKKEFSNLICYIFAFLNTCAIIFTIYCTFIYDQVINLIFPIDDHPFRDKFERNRCIILIIFQNLIIIESLELYLKDEYLKIYKLTIISIIMILLIILFFSSVSRYNFDTPINSLIQCFLTFCFANSIIEIILYLGNFKIKKIKECIFLNLSKIGLCILLMYIYNSINEGYLLKKCKIELFKINDVRINDITVYDTFYFIFEKLKLIQKKSGDITSQNILNVFFEHQSECKNEHCKCKLIRIIPSGKNFQMNFLPNLIERMGFLIETSFVQIDYTLDYDLSLLLAEYYYSFKRNYIKSYSIIQTFLHFNVEKLSIVKTIRIYCLSQKYIKSFNIWNYQNLESCVLFRNIFFVFDKMKKTEKLIIKYSGNYIQIVKYKEIFEASIKVNRYSETGEIKNMENPFLSGTNTSNIIDIIKTQIDYYNKITSLILDFHNQKMLIESHYKIFIFFELFNKGIIPKKLIPILYQFTNNKNFYLMQITDNTFSILTEKLKDKYKDINQGYNIIFSFSKGLIIKYISEYLTTKLGFAHSTLLGSDISILFPKELSGPHQNGVIKQVISEQSIFFQKKTWIFSINNQSFPIIMRSASIPGIYKNLVLISNIVFRNEENKYSFILNQNGNVISISNNFDTHYALGMKIIKKFDINLLELFEINQNYLNKAFSKEKMKAEQIKHNLEVNANEYFSKGLFRPNRGYIGEEVKFKLLINFDTRYKENIVFNESFNDILIKRRNDVENIYSKKTIEKFNYIHPEIKRTKDIVIQNLLKILTKFNGIELYDEYYKKLNESLYKFKNSISNQDLLNKSDNIREEKQSYFLIKIYLKIIYDTRFYIFKLTEISNTIPSPIKRNSFLVDSGISTKTLPSIEKIKGNHNNLFNVENKNNSQKKIVYKHHSNNNIRNNVKKNFKKQVSIKAEVSSYFIENSNLSEKINESIDNNNSTSNSINNISSNNNINSNNNNNNNDNKSEKTVIENRVKIQEFKYLITLNFILLTLIIFSLIIYIIIIFKQNNMIVTAHLIFQCLYYNYYQRDKLLIVFSSTLSLLFKFSNLWINDINSIEDYKNLIAENSLSFDKCSHLFYEYYVKHKNILGEEYKELLEERFFTKIQIDFENKTYLSDYISQSQYAFRYAYNLASFDKNEDIESDVYMILFDKYLNNIENQVKSSFGIEIFYLMVNYEGEFKYYFNSFQTSLEDCFESFSTRESKIYLILEVFGIIIYIIFFSFVLVFLYNENKAIFSNVLNMFIDFTQEGNYSFKNQRDNFIIKNKIEDYINLTKSFTVSNLKKYNSEINNGTPKILNIKKPVSRKLTAKTKSSNILLNLNIKGRTNSEQPSINTSSSINLKKNSNSNKNINKIKRLPTDKKKNQNSTIQHLNSTMTKDGNQFNEDIEPVTANNILIYMKNPGIKSIKYFWVLIIIFLSLIFIYFFLKIEYSLSYIKDIKNIFKDFGQLTYRYTLSYYYYNSLRVLLISKNIGQENVFDNYSLILDNITKNNQEILNYRIKSFKKTFELYSLLKIPWNTTSIKEKVCGSNLKCLYILETEQESKLVTDGLLIALDAVFQKILNTFNDYIYAKNFTSQDELIKKLIDKEFQLMESTLSFIINIVQDLVYYGFFNDENNIKKVFQSQVNLFNLIAIIYCILVAIVVMFGILKHISYNSKLIGKGSIRINNAFCYIKQKNLGIKIETVGTNSTIFN